MVAGPPKGCPPGLCAIDSDRRAFRLRELNKFCQAPNSRPCERSSRSRAEHFGCLNAIDQDVHRRRVAGVVADYGAADRLRHGHLSRPGIESADFGLTAIAASLIAIVDTALEIPLAKQALTRLRTLDNPTWTPPSRSATCRDRPVRDPADGGVAVLDHLRGHRLALLVFAFALGPVARSLYSPAMVKFVRAISFSSLLGGAGKVLARRPAPSPWRAWAADLGDRGEQRHRCPDDDQPVLRHGAYQPAPLASRFSEFRGFVAG